MHWLGGDETWAGFGGGPGGGLDGRVVANGLGLRGSGIGAEIALGGELAAVVDDEWLIRHRFSVVISKL
jgi:hypothetical protein